MIVRLSSQQAPANLCNNVKSGLAKSCKCKFITNKRSKHDMVISYREELGSQKNLVLEAGYLNDYSNDGSARGEKEGYHKARRTFTSIGWDGLCGKSKWQIEDCDDDRVVKHGIKIKPWRENEIKTAFVFLQLDTDRSLGKCTGRKYHEWAAKSVVDLEQQGYEVYYKPHPRRDMRLGVGKRFEGTITQALNKADLTVQYSSTCAVDSIMRGIPAITFYDGSIAWDVTGHSIDEIVRPDRTQWLNNLMYMQWKPAELASGEWWQYYKGYLEK